MKLLVGAREAEELVDDEGLAVELLVDHHAKNSELSGPEEGKSAGWEVWRVNRMPGEQFILWPCPTAKTRTSRCSARLRA